MTTDKIKPSLRIAGLISAYLERGLDDAQMVELFTWVNSSTENLGFFRSLLDEQNLTADGLRYRSVDSQAAIEKLKERIFHSEQPEVKKLWLHIATAASIVLCLGIGFYFYQRYAIKPVQDQLMSGQIKPGGNKAYLTLADGSRITLNEAVNGALAKQNGARIEKTADGQLVYVAEGEVSGGSEFNSVETPKGGTYFLQLPDGTRIWLNAASKLKYPVSFVGRQQRRVELSGEGYFEVAKDKSHPFLVTSGKQEVKVLGTHFNINSYADEGGIKTTLLEGVVSVSAEGQQVVLRPDQQAVFSASGINVADVLAESFTDWKSGEFYFRKEGLQSIMRKLSRWYDMEVEYAPGMENDQRRFSGTLSRFDDISKILGAMEKSVNLQFKVEGRKVTVLK